MIPGLSGMSLVGGPQSTPASHGAIILPPTELYDLKQRISPHTEEPVVFEASMHASGTSDAHVGWELTRRGDRGFVVSLQLTVPREGEGNLHPAAGSDAIFTTLLTPGRNGTPTVATITSFRLKDQGRPLSDFELLVSHIVEKANGLLSRLSASLRFPPFLADHFSLTQRGPNVSFLPSFLELPT